MEWGHLQVQSRLGDADGIYQQRQFREFHYAHITLGHPIADAVISGPLQTICMGNRNPFALMFPSRVTVCATTPHTVSTRYTDIASIACSALSRKQGGSTLAKGQPVPTETRSITRRHSVGNRFWSTSESIWKN